MNQQNKGDSGFKIRITGILLILFEIGIIFAYGFSVEFVQQPETSTTIRNDFSGSEIYLILCAIVSIMGYGLLLSYNYNSALSGLGTTLLSVFVTVQLAPLMISFWTKVFETSFDTDVGVQISNDVMIRAFIMCASLLLSLTILVGRLGIFETFIVILAFNIGWPLSNQLLTSIFIKKGVSTITYDQYGTTYLFVFAGFFAITASIFLNCRSGSRKAQTTNVSAAYGIIGTGIIFAFFPFTGTISAGLGNLPRIFAGPLNIYFTLVTSTICTYIFSALFGGGKVGVRQSIVGVLSGGVMVSAVAASLNNIGANIAIGAFAGLVSGFWLRVITPRLNARGSFDNLGLLGAVVLNATIGQFALAPALYRIYYKLEYNLQGLGTGGLNIDISDSKSYTYQLSYFAISAGIAICTAVIASILTCCCRNSVNDFRTNKLVSANFGLYRFEEEKPPVSHQSDQELKNNQ